MASNYRKSFNFRNGVQVDNDNFVVNANGLVGIGTTVPSDYLLNVYGDTRVTGLVTTNNLHSGVGTVGVLTATTANITNVNVSGALTASSFKLGSSAEVNNLIGYAYTAWINTGGVGLHTLSSVGIGTTEKSGLILDVLGNVNVTGVLTATSFSGIVTATDLAGTIDNARLPSSISVTDVTANTFTGNLVGIATTATNLADGANITTGTISDDRLPDLITSNLNASSGVSTLSQLDVGLDGITVGTDETSILSTSSSVRIGIGTTNPTAELQITKSTGAHIESISTAGVSTVSIGQSIGIGNSTGFLRYGYTAGDFDIVNNQTGGDVNFIVNGNGSSGYSRFSWQNGSNFVEGMSLTYDGNFTVLGVTTLASGGSITTTGGDLYVGDNLNVDGDITYTGTLTLEDVLSANIYASSGISTFTTLQINEVGIGTDDPIENIDAQGSVALFNGVGIGTTTTLDAGLRIVGKIAEFESVGVGTTSLYNDTSGGDAGKLQVHGTSLSVHGGTIVTDDSPSSAIGFGTFAPRSILDFGRVGAAATIGFMILPTLNTTQISDLAYEVEGSIIFNTSTKKFQGYDGTVWRDLH